MEVAPAVPLRSSNNANIPAKKTIEETYLKKSQLKHILLRPDTYIGSVKKHTQMLWVDEDDKMVHRQVTYVLGLYKIISFYTMPEYESWKKSLNGNSNGWTIKYYKRLGTNTSQEGKQYFKDLEKHKRDFIWVDNQDGEAIELAFSKKKLEARKNWLRQFEPGTYLDQKAKLIK